MHHSRCFLLVVATLAAGCDRDTDGSLGSPPVPGSLQATPSTAFVAGAPTDPSLRLLALRTRFPLSTGRPVIGTGVATSFDPGPGGGLHPFIPAAVKRRAHRSATVELPAHADGSVRLEDDTSHLAITFALVGAAPSPITTAGGIALYPGALAGADVVHRAHAEGTEDFVAFEARPAREELRYTVDVSHVPGLRLVSDGLELLDEEGTPRLRVAPPSVVDAGGRHSATLDLEGCAFDASPRAPWGRPVTSPGSARCVVRVAWSGVSYPALVDPAWVATGSLAEARMRHTATVLSSGKVMIAGGFGANGTGDPGLQTVEIYDPGSATFSYTGHMVWPRAGHTATTLASGKVLMAGGSDQPGSALDTVRPAELYDEGLGTFALTGSLVLGRYYQTATLLGSGKVLLTGGVGTGNAQLASAELYDPTAPGTFTLTDPMHAMRAYHSATLLASGQVLVVGGQASPTTAELFDPAGVAFAVTVSLPNYGRFGHTATRLASGMVLLTGGSGAGATEQVTADLYDPTGAGSFTALDSHMYTARAGHTATLLASGKVLVAGGYGVAETDLYDPTGAGTFAAAGTMTAAHQWHTATVLGSGQVLVVGGDDGTNAQSPGTKTAELYTVASGVACATASGCASGFCVDGVCCDTACGALCEACSAAKKGSGVDGVCGPIGAGADPDDECAQQPASSCGTNGACDGDGACGLYAAGTVCVGGACSGGTGTAASSCDGAGVCVPGNTSDCLPGYGCDGTQCATTCSDDTACAAGYVCDTSTHACELSTGCSSSSTAGSSTASSSSATAAGSTSSSTAGSTTATTGAGGAGVGAGGAGGAAASAGSGASPGSGQSSGCGCVVAGGDSPGNALGVSALLAMATSLRLRRRRRAA